MTIIYDRYSRFRYTPTMAYLRACLAIAAIALTACGGGDGGADAQIFKDAPPNYDFSCTGASAPTTATDTVTVYGIVQEVFADEAQAGTPAFRPLAGAALEACTVGSNTCADGQATSQGDGTFVIGPHPTGGTPYNGQLHVTHNGDRITYLYPDQPLKADFHGVSVPMLLNAFVAQLAALGLSQDAAKGLLALQLIDCTGALITDHKNVTLIIQQNGSDVSGTNIINAASFSHAFDGDYFILNVPVGQTNVGASYNGVTMRTLRNHTIESIAQATTVTQLRPGY
jgi:hypothetical protein